MEHNKIAHKWYLKGKEENDAFDQLIYFWISYNALYGQLGFGDKKGTKEFVKNNCESKYDVLLDENNAAYTYFKNTIINDCRIGHSNSTASEKQILNDACKSKQEKLIALMLCVYQARCNLFHGNKTSEGYRDKEIVANAVLFLQSYLDIYYQEKGEVNESSNHTRKIK